MQCDYMVRVRSIRAYRCKSVAPLLCLRKVDDTIVGWLCQKHANEIAKFSNKFQMVEDNKFKQLPQSTS